MANDDVASDQNLINLSAEIVAAYASRNALNPGDIAKLISDVHGALAGLGAGPAPAAEVAQEPAVPVKKSLTDSFIVCLEDGKKFKSLKRHLSTHHHLTPEAYREKWKLPSNYPMVAAGYSKTRSELAKASGLGKVNATEAKKAPRGKAKR